MSLRSVSDKGNGNILPPANANSNNPSTKSIKSIPIVPSTSSSTEVLSSNKNTIVQPSSMNKELIHITGEELDNIELLMERQYNQQLTKQMEVSNLSYIYIYI